jgi:hypothetical protein
MEVTKIDYSKFEVFDDPMFKFDADAHKYTYQCDKTGESLFEFQSVTGFKEQFKEPFNSRKTAENLSKSNILYGKPVDEILQIWGKKGTDAADLGTRVHEWIENFYGEKEQIYNIEDTEFLNRINKFQEIHKERLFKLKSIFQEKRIFSKKWKLAGTLDCLFETTSQILLIGDYKTNAKLTTDKDFLGTNETVKSSTETIKDFI